MHTVFCGLTTIDLIQHVSTLPSSNQKVTSESAILDVGGPAANAARTAAALGAVPTLVSPIGTGVFADLAHRWLAEAQVHVVDLAAEGDPAISSVVVDRSGQRSVVSTNNAGRTHGFPPADILDGAAVLLVDGHLLDVQIALARTAEGLGIPVVLDGGSYKSGIESLLPHVTHAVISADFALPQLSPQPAEDPSMLLATLAGYGIGFVARTQGPQPIDALVDGKLYRLPIEGVEPGAVADTLGAGDVIHGAFVAALGAGHEALPSLASAAQLASISVRHPGAMGWVDELARMIDDDPESQSPEPSGREL